MCKLMVHFDGWLKSNHPSRYTEFTTMFLNGSYDHEMLKLVTYKAPGFTPEDFPFLVVCKLSRQVSITLRDAAMEEKIQVLRELVKAVREEVAMWETYLRLVKVWQLQQIGKRHDAAAKVEEAVQEAWDSQKHLEAQVHVDPELEVAAMAVSGLFSPLLFNFFSGILIGIPFKGKSLNFF